MSLIHAYSIGYCYIMMLELKEDPPGDHDYATRWMFIKTYPFTGVSSSDS